MRYSTSKTGKIRKIIAGVLDRGWGLNEYGKSQKDYDEVIDQALKEIYFICKEDLKDN